MVNMKKQANWKDKKIHLVLTTYNEDEVIERVIQDCYRFIKKIPHGKIIVTEDGSTDDTKKILKKLKRILPINVMMSDKRKGASQAYRDALQIARRGADLVLFTDSDGQHTIDDFFKLLKLSGKYDMVIGWKKNRQDNLVRVIGSRVFNWYWRVLFNLSVHDINCGFRVIDKKILDGILDKKSLFPECVMAELTLRAHLKKYTIAEIPVSHHARIGAARAWKGKSMLSTGWKLFVASLKLRFA